MNRFKWVVAISLVSLLVCSGTAFAEDTPGEVWVQLKGSDYAKPFVENSEYADHEFEKNGFKLVIKLADYTSRVYEFTLKPSNPEMGSVVVETNPKKFRRKKVGRRDYRMVMKVKVHFKKQSAAPPKAPVRKPKAPVKKKAPAKKG